MTNCLCLHVSFSKEFSAKKKIHSPECPNKGDGDNQVSLRSNHATF